MNDHLFIPDCQVKKDVPLQHLLACGNYIVETQPSTIVCIGDFADVPSLSVYDKAGSKSFEGKRYRDDIESSYNAMELLLSPLREYNARQVVNKKKKYKPRMVMTLGNHENRINRAIESNPNHLEGIMSIDDLQYEQFGWEVYPFLEVVSIDGVNYSHYFVNPNSLTGNPVGGNIQTKLNNLKTTFSMGHQQSLQFGHSYDANGNRITGLVAGSFYLHDEDYMGPQKNQQHWRGIVHKRNVRDGKYSPEFKDIEDLMMEYL